MPSFVRTLRVLAAAGALSALPAALSAQSAIEPDTISVTPFLSSAFGTSADLGSSLGLGVAVAYDLTTRLGVEGELGHVFDVFGDSANVDLALTNVHGNVVYHFPVPRVTPYATFGVGIERASVDVKVPDPAALYPASSTEVGYNFGGGVKYPLTELFVLRADLRRFQSTDLAPDYWRVYGGLSWWIKR